MRREGDDSVVVSGVSSALNRRVPVSRSVDDSWDVAVVDCGWRFTGWRVRDIVW